MTAGTCLEHPHHEALLQFAQVPRMHIVAVDGGVGGMKISKPKKWEAG